jgi:hypothetical protein
MERRSLGRGLDDISEIFLSETEEEESEKNFRGLSSVKIRDEDCSSCIHFILSTPLDPQCRIFTFENEKYGVPPKDTIPLNNGNYCRYFEFDPIGETKRLVNNKNNESDLAEIECKVEEIVRVDRKIAYPDNENTQKSLRKILFEHLEEGYEIRSIKIKKNEEILAKRRRDLKDVTISIIVE